jgi:hypothetical protein
MLGGSIHIIRKNTEALVTANRESGLEVKPPLNQFLQPTPTIHSRVPVSIFFKLCRPVSEIVAQYGLQAQISLTYLITFECRPLNQNASKKNNGKITEISVTHISSLASVAQFTFETYT